MRLKFKATKDMVSYLTPFARAYGDGVQIDVSDRVGNRLLNLFPNNWIKIEATLPAGKREVVVEHKLGRKPKKVSATPTANVGNVWVTDVNSNTFKINTSATRNFDITFYWDVD